MAPVPSSHDFTSGIATTSEANAYIRDPIAFLLNRPRAELRQTVAQSFTSATITAVTFTTEDVDTDPSGTGGHDNVTNNTRWTAVYAGWYQVSGGVTFVPNVTGDRFCWLRVNGTDVNASIGFQAGDATGLATPMCRTKLVFLNVGDYVELIGYQDTGAPLLSSVTTREQPNMSILWASNA